MICHTKKFIFCHHGKCAGTSIKNALKESLPKLRKEMRPTISGHLSLKEMYDLIREHGNNPKDYLKFTVVRNPWDRIVSWYYHWQKIQDVKVDFNHFVEERKMPYKHLDKMDFILQFENLRKDWTKLCRKLDIPRAGLPHVQYSTNRPKRDYKQYYNDESRDLVAERHKEVIEMFDYKF